jgi:dCMP deaminase
MNRQEKWDLRFLKLAKEVSSWSKDCSTQIGAVIVRNVNEIVSLGYNGFPKGDLDLEEDYANRDIKYSKVIHGEINALRFANFAVNGCTLYTYPFESCAKCAKEFCHQGIKRVVSYEPSLEILSRWEKSIMESRRLFSDFGVEHVLYQLE